MTEQEILYMEKIRSNSSKCRPSGIEYMRDFPRSFVLYVETTYDRYFNQFIESNFEQIEQNYKDYGLVFLYLPRLLKQNWDILEYRRPGTVLNKDITSENITLIITAKLLAELNISSDTQQPMLLTCVETRRAQYFAFSITRFGEDIPIEQFFIAHARVWQDTPSFFEEDSIEIDKISYSVPIQEPYVEIVDNYREGKQAIRLTGNTSSYVAPDRSDEWFDRDVNRIVSEIDERINLLKDKGLFRLLAETIAPMLTPQLSSLNVTEDFRIFLPDYQNLEIELNPLSKAVYFLFLRYREGIFIKDMLLYRDELTQIYRLLSDRENMGDMDESIRKLSDSSDNSIYEKCSRIKRAFLQHFSSELAHNYYVTGLKGEPKKIVLDSQLIVLPDSLKDIPIIDIQGIKESEASRKRHLELLELMKKVRDSFDAAENSSTSIIKSMGRSRS